MWFRIDRFVGDVGRPNDLISDVAIWSANVDDDGRHLIVVADDGRLLIVVDVARRGL
jgi:hypothetical protein